MKQKSPLPANEPVQPQLGENAPQKSPPEFQLKSDANPETVIASGFVASQARMLMLMSRATDLRQLAQLTNQRRLQLANTQAALSNQLVNMDPESQRAHRIQAEIQRIHEMDRQLEMELQRIEGERNSVAEEREAIRRIMEENGRSIFQGMG